MEDLKEHILEDLVRKVVIEGIFSAAIKLGSLEKTIGASLIVLWCVLSSTFL